MQSDVDVIRAIYAAFSRGDVGHVLSALAPKIEWIEAEGFPYGGTYRTPDEVLRMVFARLVADWNDFSVTPRDFVCDRRSVVVIGNYSGTYKATGKAFKAPFAHIWKLHEHAVVGFQQFTDTALVQQAMR